MWIASKLGFYSIVHKEGAFQVGARVKGDLERLSAEIKPRNSIREPPRADYGWRLALNAKEPTYRLEVFLALHLEGDGEVKRPLFSLEAPGLDLASVKAQEDALQCLREILAGPEPQGYLVGLGSVRIEVVPVVHSS